MLSERSDLSGQGDDNGNGASSDHDVAAIWARVRRRLRAELGDDVFSSWFARIELTSIAHGTAELTIPTKFLKSWIQAHYSDRILARFVEEAPGVQQIALHVRSAGPRARDNAQRAPATVIELHANGLAHRKQEIESTGAAPAAEVGGLPANPLDRKMTFETFFVSKSNALARAAAEKVAAAPGSAYNPLYVHAGVGLGKSHLLQAVAHAAAAQGRRVVYLTADGFMYGFVAALKAQNALAFKEKLRGIDMLVIDDVQFLQGKTIQHEFCHTLNALLDAGKQIVVASHCAASDLENLDERARSRLGGGLVVEMEAHDEELRLRILESRFAAAHAAHPNFEAPPEVIRHVARKITANGRDLEGAVNRLLAHATLSGAPLTIETADMAIRDLVRSCEPRKVKIEDIQKLVATHFNVSRADILSSRRTANVVRPRQIAMYLSKTLTLRSLPEIGRRFGGRDHTTVLHAVRKVDDLLTRDPSLRDEVELLRRMLTD
ncbi:MAG: chromosomal replication initiation protein DnaA [Rhizobiales bacterium 65-9]|nr:chromosomal replication initiator protein DnaA [Hyphomicrobiales bacterium]OJY37226.1 MAG: chromosomal replication initiation protein DnaA [Rhizobiales bacterium 65-9]